MKIINLLIFIFFIHCNSRPFIVKNKYYKQSREIEISKQDIIILNKILQEIPEKYLDKDFRNINRKPFTTQSLSKVSDLISSVFSTSNDDQISDLKKSLNTLEKLSKLKASDNYNQIFYKINYQKNLIIDKLKDHSKILYDSLKNYTWERNSCFYHSALSAFLPILLDIVGIKTIRSWKKQIQENNKYKKEQKVLEALINLFEEHLNKNGEKNISKKTSYNLRKALGELLPDINSGKPHDDRNVISSLIIAIAEYFEFPIEDDDIQYSSYNLSFNELNKKLNERLNLFNEDKYIIHKQFSKIYIDKFHCSKCGYKVYNLKYILRGPAVKKLDQPSIDMEETTCHRCGNSIKPFLILVNRPKIYISYRDYFSHLTKEKFPLNIVMKPNEFYKKNCKYTLRAISVKMGKSIPNGHFITYVYNKKNKIWFKYNDMSTVTHTTYEEMEEFLKKEENNASVVFYERVD